MKKDDFVWVFEPDLAWLGVIVLFLGLILNAWVLRLPQIVNIFWFSLIIFVSGAFLGLCFQKKSVKEIEKELRK